MWIFGATCRVTATCHLFFCIPVHTKNELLQWLPKGMKIKNSIKSISIKSIIFNSIIFKVHTLYSMLLSLEHLLVDVDFWCNLQSHCYISFIHLNPCAEEKWIIVMITQGNDVCEKICKICKDTYIIITLAGPVSDAVTAGSLAMLVLHSDFPSPVNSSLSILNANRIPTKIN